VCGVRPEEGKEGHLAEFTPLRGAVIYQSSHLACGRHLAMPSFALRAEKKQMTFFRCEAANDVSTIGRHK
jgi:hypothetical protein